MLLSCSLPFLVCSGFQHIPSRSALRKKIEKGMTKREVLVAAGEPSSKQNNEWTYHTNFWGIHYFVVKFDEDGQVESVYID